MTELNSSAPWPSGLSPEQAPVFHCGEILIEASPKVVWDWLVRAPLWPSYNNDISGVVLLDPSAAELMLGSDFHWRRRGYALLSSVTDYLPYARLGWEQSGLWLHGFQKCLLFPNGEGCRFRIEETAAGFLPWVGRRHMRRALALSHAQWLAELRRVAVSKAPPGNIASDA